MPDACATISPASSMAMTTPSEPGFAAAPADPAPERRLHPWSWLFVLIGQLRQFAVPLLVLLFTGRGDRSQLWPLLGVGVLMLTSALQYFTYRYRIGSDSITVRSGWLHRSRREIPYARIHNVVLQQSLLHRLAGVAEVRLESAGGQKPEAQMRVLRLDQALALERLVRGRGSAGAAVADAIVAHVLLALPPAELVRLGLVSNRGLVVVGAAFAAATQFSPRLLPDWFESWGAALFGWAGARDFSSAQYALAAASLVLACVALLRLLSVALAWLQYHGFRLSEQGRRLTVERGLLARVRTSATRRRLQAWTLREGLLHRCFRRRSLQVDSAVGGDPGETRRNLRELAPIATPQACDALIRHLLPAAGWEALQWRPLHPHAWRRLCLPGACFALVATAALAWRFGAWGGLALAWLPWAAYAARQHAQRAGYALNARLVAVRGGWWSRHWRFAEIDKLQVLRLERTPFDRRHGMATLWLDTAGAGAREPPLRIRFIAESEARALYAQLGREAGGGHCAGECPVSGGAGP